MNTCQVFPMTVIWKWNYVHNHAVGQLWQILVDSSGLKIRCSIIIPVIFCKLYNKLGICLSSGWNERSSEHRALHPDQPVSTHQTGAGRCCVSWSQTSHKALICRKPLIYYYVYLHHDGLPNPLGFLWYKCPSLIFVFNKHMHFVYCCV